MAFRIGDSIMKLKYYPETDSLYIDLSEHSSVESREISEGVILIMTRRGACRHRH